MSLNKNLNKKKTSYVGVSLGLSHTVLRISIRGSQMVDSLERIRGYGLVEEVCHKPSLSLSAYNLKIKC